MISKRIYIGILVLSLIVMACSPKQETPTTTEQQGNVAPEVQPDASPNLEEEIQDLGASEDEVDISDLDGLEQDLA